MDFSTYQPAPNVLERLRTVDFVAVVGPSGVGKSTLMTLAAKQDPRLHPILTSTTRELRPEEADGVNIHWRRAEDMQARIARKELVQVAPALLGSDLYATAPEDYPAEGIGTLEVLADAVPAFRALPFKSFKVLFVVPPNRERWQAQLKTHAFDPVRLAKRVSEAKRSFTFALETPDVVFVINDDINLAVSDFIALISGDTISPRVQADQQRAKEVIQSILGKL